MRAEVHAVQGPAARRRQRLLKVLHSVELCTMVGGSCSSTRMCEGAHARAETWGTFPNTRCHTNGGRPAGQAHLQGPLWGGIAWIFCSIVLAFCLPRPCGSHTPHAT